MLRFVLCLLALSTICLAFEIRTYSFRWIKRIMRMTDANVLHSSAELQQAAMHMCPCADDQSCLDTCGATASQCLSQCNNMITQQQCRAVCASALLSCKQSVHPCPTPQVLPCMQCPACAKACELSSQECYNKMDRWGHLINNCFGDPVCQTSGGFFPRRTCTRPKLPCSCDDLLGHCLAAPPAFCHS